jgi:hypothetical protein
VALTISIWEGCQIFHDYENYVKTARSAIRSEMENDPIFWAFDVMVDPTTFAERARQPLRRVRLRARRHVLELPQIALPGPGGGGGAGNDRIEVFLKFIECFLACTLTENQGTTSGTREERIRLLKALYAHFNDLRILELMRKYSIRDHV